MSIFLISIMLITLLRFFLACIPHIALLGVGVTAAYGLIIGPSSHPRASTISMGLSLLWFTYRIFWVLYIESLIWNKEFIMNTIEPIHLLVWCLVWNSTLIWLSNAPRPDRVHDSLVKSECLGSMAWVMLVAYKYIISLE